MRKRFQVQYPVMSLQKSNIWFNKNAMNLFNPPCNIDLLLNEHDRSLLLVKDGSLEVKQKDAGAIITKKARKLCRDLERFFYTKYFKVSKSFLEGNYILTPLYEKPISNP